LSRITSPIWLEEPILSNFECENHSFNLDAEDFGKQIPELDLAYLDPPYNQHPYGSNYFMLNLIADYDKPEDISEVSGIPKNWQRSDFNVKNLSFEKLQRVIKNLNTKYILISFSDEGFIKPTQMRKFLNSIGKLDEMKISYNTYRGSRNLKNRNIKMHEHLYLLKIK
jgi:adenine-specific DNA-methyltransferase